MRDEEDAEFLWRPWSPQGAFRDSLMVVSGSGCEVEDASGHRYLDAKGCHLSASVGYGHPTVVAAVADQAATLMTYDLMTGITGPAVQLAAKIAGLAGGSLSRTFFCSSGSEATETAVKMARMYHGLRGEPDRRWVLSLDAGYHGSTLAAAGMTNLPLTRAGNEPFPAKFATVPAPRCSRCIQRIPHGACEIPGPEYLAAAMESIGPERVAAFIVEPVLGVGGLVFPPAGYLAGVREVCDRFGALLIVDEVMTGFGRTGRWFAFEHAEITPDILTTSKGLSGGYVPLAAVTARRDIYDTFTADPLLGGFRHGHTMSGHATACAAGLAVLDVIESNGLVEHAAALGADLLTALLPLAERRWIHDVRGLGLLIGIETVTAEQAAWLAGAARDSGVLVRCQDEVVIVAPPLVLSGAQGVRIVEVLTACAARYEEERR